MSDKQSTLSGIIKEKQSDESPKNQSFNENESSTIKEKRQLPQNPVEILKLTKSGGITLPKLIRSQLEEKQLFAFWKEDDRYILMPVKEYEIPDLNLLETKKKSNKVEDSDTKAKKTRKKRTAKQKPSTGPQPELTKYFPFPLENQEKIQNAVEASFYKLIEIPPKIDEVIERIKYIIINYGIGKTTNDSRLKHTIVLFIDDIISKVPEQDFTPILEYLSSKIVPNIDSTFLREQSLITLCGTTLKAQLPELALSLLRQVFAGIDSYDQEFAIMQGIKSIMKKLQSIDVPLSEDFQLTVQKNLSKFIIGKSKERFIEVSESSNNEQIILSTDNCLEIIELMQNFQMIDAAMEAAQKLLERIPPEDIHIEDVRAKVNSLRKHSR
ncbi:MAG: hypothetical protein K9W44_10640 [Candidatus Lokiarchaeota archaeon]|nr:hypothetical protein [Candidatus Harpocratesius repetitus]